MTKVTHSPLKEGHVKSYVMKINEKVVGYAWREPKAYEKFVFKPSVPEMRLTTARTMKELKVKILWIAQKDEEFWKYLQPKPKPTSITVKDAIQMACLSHNAVREFLREIREYHPRMKRNQLGAYMVRREYENAAEWSWGGFARKWLSKNPTVGIYQKFEVEPGVWISPAT